MNVSRPNLNEQTQNVTKFKQERQELDYVNDMWDKILQHIWEAAR
jgi:hypothetical protein